MRTSTTCILYFLLAAFAGTSCRKPKGAAPAASFTGCRISQVTEYQVDTSQNATYTFAYNDDGTVSSITLTSKPASDIFIKRITYPIGSIVVTSYDNGYITGKDSVQPDAQNHIVYIDHIDNYSSPRVNEVYDTYAYDSLGNLVSQTSYSYNTVSTTTYQWKNGDLQWNTAGTDYYTYQYDSTVYNTGNTKELMTDFEKYGRSIFTPSHLCTAAIMDGAYTTTYNNTLDSGGRLTRLTRTETGGYTYTTAISYECK